MSLRLVPPVLAALAVALGAALRVSGLEALLPYGDEFHGLAISRAPYGLILSTWDYLGSGMALPFLQRVFADAFGPSLFVYRLPVVLGGLAGIALVYAVASRLVGRTAAALATLALCASSLHIFYSHFSRAYSLVGVVSLCLVHGLGRMRADPASRRWAVCVALCTALLPYLHLSAMALVASAALGAGLQAVVDGRSRGGWIRLIATFAAGAGLCLLLYLPVLLRAHGFFVLLSRASVEVLPFGFFEVATVVTGSLGAALVCTVALPAAAVAILRTRGADGILLVCVALVPIPILIATRPFGGVFQWAHYLLAPLPFMAMLLAWGLVACSRRALRSRTAADAFALLAGTALVGASYWLGPLGRAHTDAGPYANSYIEMQALPRFDAPFPDTPSFYARLAKAKVPTRIVEAPALMNRSLFLYRNYYLQHRSESLLGFVDSDANGLTGPLIVLSRRSPTAGSARKTLRQRLRARRVDYVVLHTDIESEVASYFDFVRRAGWPTEGLVDLSAFMGHLATPGRIRNPSPHAMPRLVDALGPPTWEADGLAVWKVGRPKRGRAR